MCPFRRRHVILLSSHRRGAGGHDGGHGQRGLRRPLRLAGVAGPTRPSAARALVAIPRR